MEVLSGYKDQAHEGADQRPDIGDHIDQTGKECYEQDLLDACEPEPQADKGGDQGDLQEDANAIARQQFFDLRQDAVQFLMLLLWYQTVEHLLGKTLLFDEEKGNEEDGEQGDDHAAQSAKYPFGRASDLSDIEVHTGQQIRPEFLGIPFQSELLGESIQTLKVDLCILNDPTSIHLRPMAQFIHQGGHHENKQSAEYTEFNEKDQGGGQCIRQVNFADPYPL